MLLFGARNSVTKWQQCQSTDKFWQLFETTSSSQTKYQGAATQRVRLTCCVDDVLVGLLGVAELQAPVRLKVAGKEANVHKRRRRLTATNQEEHSMTKLHCIQEILTPQKRGFLITEICLFLCPTCIVPNMQSTQKTYLSLIDPS
jgi:hypothetical protein